MPRPEAAIPNHTRSDAIRCFRPSAQHERAIALRADGRFAAAERACRRAIAGYRGDRGSPARRRRQRARRARAGAGGARSPARGGPLPAPGAAHPRCVDRVGRSGHRAAVDPRAHGAGRHRPDAGRLRRRRSRLPDRAREIRRRFGPRDRYIAGVLNDLGVLRKAQGRYDEALAFYRRALPLVPRSDRDAHATLAHNLGGIEHARGNYARAEPHARRSVRLRTALVGAAHPAVAADVAALAAIVEARGPPGRGRRALRPRAGGVQRTCSARGSLEVGLNLACLAAVEQRRRRPARARSCTRGRSRSRNGCSAATTPTSP